jgi:hypothetical protein
MIRSFDVDFVQVGKVDLTRTVTIVRRYSCENGIYVAAPRLSILFSTMQALSKKKINRMNHFNSK